MWKIPRFLRKTINWWKFFESMKIEHWNIWNIGTFGTFSTIRPNSANFYKLGTFSKNSNKVSHFGNLEHFPKLGIFFKFEKSFKKFPTFWKMFQIFEQFSKFLNNFPNFWTIFQIFERFSKFWENFQIFCFQTHKKSTISNFYNENSQQNSSK